MNGQLCFDSQDQLDQTWHKMAVAAVQHLALTGRRFTVDDVRDLVEPLGAMPHDDRMWGSLMKAELAAGHIRAVGDFVRSRRATQGGRWVMVWAGVDA